MKGVYMQENNKTMPTIDLPKPTTKRRKIGRTTFIVSSSFNENGKGDIVSKIARLIENDNKGA